MVGTPGEVAVNRLLTPTQYARDTQSIEEIPLFWSFK